VGDRKVMDKIFAEEYPRNEQGWILFPSEKGGKRRQDVFPVPKELLKHPAKAGTAMIESIVEFVSQPGDTIMDIMAGVGTILTAERMDRNVICIEIEDKYFTKLTAIKELLGLNALLLHGDCRDYLPIPTNHIIFSPPYAGVLKSSKGMDSKWKTMHITHDEQMDYSASPKNVGNLNLFLYNQAMEHIYDLCYQSILPGGTLTAITKDFMDAGNRVFLSLWVMRVCVGFGFTLLDWFKRLSTGSGYQEVHRVKGIATVDDEDVLIFRK
jgi:hypothetical protein